MTKFDVGEAVTYRDLNGNEQTGIVWSAAAGTAQRWITTEDQKFVLITFARERGNQWQVIDGQMVKVPPPINLREVPQDWRAELAKAQVNV